MTNREFVGQILSDFKSVSKDTYIPRRYILREARTIVTTYMAQRLDNNTLYNAYDIIQTIDCLKLKKEDVIKCGVVEFNNCNSLMKSEKELKGILTGRVGVSIFSVSSIDDGYEFRYVTPKGFKNKKRNKYIRDLEKYYTVKNGYLYLLNSEVEAVRVELISLEESSIEDCDCNKEGKSCKTIWEDAFVCPDNILSLVKEGVLKSIASFRMRISKDENPDLDENTKSYKSRN